MTRAIAQRIFTVLMAALLAACVTTEGRVFTEEASPQEAMQKRVELARQYIGQGNWDDAKRNLKLAQDIDPSSPEVHEAFALVYQSTGEYELAEESFKRAISLKRDFSRARNNYAAFLYSQQRYEEAQEQLEIVVKDTLYESRPRAFINLGLCRVRLGDSEGARAAFQRALTMDRGNAIALLELAHIEYDDSNWAAAEVYLETYRRSVRQHSARSLWLGVRLAHARQDADAQASFAMALRNLYPDSAEYQEYERAVKSGQL
jgi:type IV pilus assembly protein PilF